MQRLLIAILSLFLITTISGCTGKQKQEQKQNKTFKTIRIVGSTSMLPVSERLARSYEKIHPDVRIYVQGGDSSLGVKGVANRIAEIGALSRPLTAGEKEKFEHFLLTDDNISVIVNPKMSITHLTLDNLRDIFGGKVINWKDVGGPDHAITVITREQGSGTHNVFLDTVMGHKNRIAANALVMASTGAVRTAVANDKFAIGYISFQYLSDGVNPVPVDDGISKSIILNRPLIYITNKPVDSVTRGFIDFALGSEGKVIVTEHHMN